MPDSPIGPIVGVILAGGRASRMGGGDKGLQEVGGSTILARVIERVQPQVDALVLNANGDPARFASYGLPVIPCCPTACRGDRGRWPVCSPALPGRRPTGRRRATS